MRLSKIEYNVTMKARVDFVSNSSSSSFVVACQKQYLDDVLKDLAKSCTNKRSPYHDKALAGRNKCILDFCVRTFQLAFIGKLLVKTKAVKYSLDYFKKIWISGRKDPNASKAAEKEWEHYKNVLKSIKDGQSRHGSVYDWEKDAYSLDEYDEATDTAVHYEKTYAQGIVVPNSTMESTFNRYHFNGAGSRQETAEEIDRRVKAIVEIAKAHVAADRRASANVCFESIDTYQITKDTIDNTRDLISRGYVVDLARWEDLDALEARIAHGDALFYVRIANSGDGYGDFYIYCEDDADGIDGISGIELLACESM